MSLPDGVTTCTVTAGVPVTHTGAPVKAFVSIEPSVFLVHTATGTPLVDFLEELSINEGVAGQFTLPHTDQAGFQDENGNAYSNWYYTARISYSTPSKAKTKAPKIKVFQLVAGQTIVDLDALPGGAPALPYTAPIATVSSFGGRTGPVALTEGDLPARLSSAQMSATYLDRLGTKTDTSAGLVDWQNNAASGYLMHLRTGPASTGAAAAVGIGTDLGGGSGILISHKNAGKGILATGQPGSGLIAEFTSRGSGSGFWTNVQAGGGAFQVNARDGGGFPDGASTGGSTTFTSATAAFVAGDVGKAIVQLTSRGDTDPFGSIQAGTTIASVTNSTTVVLSQPAAATGTNVMFNIAGRLPALTQALFRVMDTDLLTELVKFSRGGAVFAAADVASVPVRVNAKAGQTGDLFQVYDASSTKGFSVASNGGARSAVNSIYNNAALLGAPPLETYTYSSHPAIKAGRQGAGSGDNAQFLGAGTTALSRVNKDGYYITSKSTAPADADLAVGEGAVWIDPTPGTGGMRWKIKATDGSIINKTL